MSEPHDLRDCRAALVRYHDADLPRVFDRPLQEGTVITLSRPDGPVASLEVRRAGGRHGAGLHLVLRYPADHKAVGRVLDGPIRVVPAAGRGWAIDYRRKEGR